MKNVRMIICLVATVLFMPTRQGFGVEFKDGGIYNINSTINDNVSVDDGTPGMQTTVNLLTGAIIDSPYRLRGYNDSIINVLGECMIDTLKAYDDSKITISSSTATVHYVTAYDNSQITVSCNFRNNGDFFLYDNSSATVTDGYFSIIAAGRQLTISGGTIWFLPVRGSITITGGSVSFYGGNGEAQITMSGGTIMNNGEIGLGETIELILNGSNFAVDGNPVGFGTILTGGIDMAPEDNDHGSEYDYQPYRQLTGTLANGDIINSAFRLGQGSKIVLIPEPATLLLFGLGGLILRKRS